MVRTARETECRQASEFWKISHILAPQGFYLYVGFALWLEWAPMVCIRNLGYLWAQIISSKQDYMWNQRNLILNQTSLINMLASWKLLVKKKKKYVSGGFPGVVSVFKRHIINPTDIMLAKIQHSTNRHLNILRDQYTFFSLSVNQFYLLHVTTSHM